MEVAGLSIWIWLAIYLTGGMLCIAHAVGQDFYNKWKGHRIDVLTKGEILIVLCIWPLVAGVAIYRYIEEKIRRSQFRRS